MSDLNAEKLLGSPKEPVRMFRRLYEGFDYIKHENLIEVLKETGLYGHDITIICSVYWNHEGCVRTGNGNTNFVDMKKRRPQEMFTIPTII